MITIATVSWSLFLLAKKAQPAAAAADANMKAVLFALVALVVGVIAGIAIAKSMGGAAPAKKGGKSGQDETVSQAVALRDEVDQHAKRWHSLSSVISALGSLTGTDKLYDLISHTAREHMKSDYSAVFSRDRGDFIVRSSDNLSKETLAIFKIPANVPFVSYMSQTAAPVILSAKKMDREMAAFSKFKEGVKNIICAPLKSDKSVSGLLWVANSNADALYSEQDKSFMNLLAMFFSMSLNNAELKEKEKKIFQDTLITLATSLEARDAYTKMHSYNVAEYSVTFAKALRVASSDVETLKLSARLHDIGKIGIRDDILNKPGKLTDEEFEIIKSHPGIGAKILEPLGFLSEQIPYVKYHHEKWDGTGYPDGLKGDQIPLGAQILSLADVFDALTTDRPYRKGFSIEKTFDIMKDMSGKNFEAGLLQRFFTVIETDVMGKRP